MSTNLEPVVNTVYCLALGSRLILPVEQHLLGRICELKLTPVSLLMLTTVFHPLNSVGLFLL